MTAPVPTPHYRFGAFEANAASGELRRQGLRVKLNAQPFEVLLMLLERPGELVTRDEISRRLWPDGTFVDSDHGVNSAVNRIREALGDSASNPRFIETLARRGYRFVAPVQQIDGIEAQAPGTPATEASSHVPETEPDSQPSPEPRVLPRVLASPQDLPKTQVRSCRPCSCYCN